MVDPIDRQAAIDAIEKVTSSMSVCLTTDEYYGMTRMKGMAISALIALPSAQPEIIRCKDCKHWLHEHLCIELSKYGTIETLPNEYCNRAERRTDG